jgi:hypothetical protein
MVSPDETDRKCCAAPRDPVATARHLRVGVVFIALPGSLARQWVLHRFLDGNSSEGSLLASPGGFETFGLLLLGAQAASMVCGFVVGTVAAVLVGRRLVDRPTLTGWLVGERALPVWDPFIRRLLAAAYR